MLPAPKISSAMKAGKIPTPIIAIDAVRLPKNSETYFDAVSPTTYAEVATSAAAMPRLKFIITRSASNPYCFCAKRRYPVCHTPFVEGLIPSSLTSMSRTMTSRTSTL